MKTLRKIKGFLDLDTFRTNTNLIMVSILEVLILGIEELREVKEELKKFNYTKR